MSGSLIGAIKALDCWSSLVRALRSEKAEEVMNTEYIVTAIIALLLLGYLVFALLKPEKF